jgi:phospholipase C
MNQTRRQFLGLLAKVAGATSLGGMLPASIERALAIPAARRTGTIRDVEHIVILTQENRSFDHYFGTLGGVRGFGDPFPIPVPDAPGITNRTVWCQPNADTTSSLKALAPFRLNTTQNFDYMRVMGAVHTWPDAQQAWNHGRLNAWTLAKRNHALGYFAADDIPFQWALANAFTLCDAYHCALQMGTNPNRLFVWTGTNDGLALGNGPATYNDYDMFDVDPGFNGGYTWVTFAERLQAAGVSWQVYQNMEDNFYDNPLAGFRVFRDAYYQRPGFSQALRDRGVTTRDLDLLRADVMADRLPQVSWVVGSDVDSEHPEPSSPAQGADYTARVLDALTANPEVWAKTVFFIHFDENDGFFDHVPPPAPPSYVSWNADPKLAVRAGDSTVDTAGEYHEHLVSYHADAAEAALLHRPYGLGPRVPLYVVSPWSKGGWVNSQVFDHTSILRFVEARFGVSEPNISAWRREVCGDLQSAFNFSDPDETAFSLPATRELADRARALPGQTTPPTPTVFELPVQDAAIRPSRALPYHLGLSSQVQKDGIEITFRNAGTVGALFHVYDRLNLGAIPRRYTVGAGRSLSGSWDGTAGHYDLWIQGPGGFHRHLVGAVNRAADAWVRGEPSGPALRITLDNTAGAGLARFAITAQRYQERRELVELEPGARAEIEWGLPNGPWYDLAITLAGGERDGNRAWLRRAAGRVETGRHSFSDPALGGRAIADR